MAARDVVYGLVNTSPRIPDPAVASACRDWTITWSRYDYHGPIIEDTSVDRVLSRACREGYRMCFVQTPGQIVRERWRPDDHAGFLDALAGVLSNDEALVAGRIEHGPDGWYGLREGGLLVDMARYAAWGEPAFGAPTDESRDVPAVTPRREDGAIVRLESAPGTDRATPRRPGWGLVAASLGRGAPVIALPSELREHVLDLEPASPDSCADLARLLADGIAAYGSGGAPGLTDDQAAFFDTVSVQAANARRGVFLLNIEAYTDVESPPAGWIGPVSSLYSVAAGFKPNRMLQTYGMDDSTRVVFFDYSAQALAVRRTLVEEWDGEDFVGFARRLLERFPAPDTFYQLWAGATPETLDWSQVRRMWEGELVRLGGERAFRDHWRRYRALPHEYVHCDILGAPDGLFDRVRAEPNAVMWFSNAPFTMYANWRHPLAARHAMYERFLRGLAARNGAMLLFGSDADNSNVNCVTAGACWELYGGEARDPLRPRRLHRYEVRM